MTRLHFAFEGGMAVVFCVLVMPASHCFLNHNLMHCESLHVYAYSHAYAHIPTNRIHFISNVIVIRLETGINKLQIQFKSVLVR